MNKTTTAIERMNAVRAAAVERTNAVDAATAKYKVARATYDAAFDAASDTHDAADDIYRAACVEFDALVAVADDLISTAGITYEIAIITAKGVYESNIKGLT